MDLNSTMTFWARETKIAKTLLKNIGYAGGFFGGEVLILIK